MNLHNSKRMGVVLSLSFCFKDYISCLDFWRSATAWFGFSGIVVLIDGWYLVLKDIVW